MKELGELDRFDYDSGYYLDGDTINEFLNERAKQGWELHTIQLLPDRAFCVFHRIVLDERKVKMHQEARGLTQEFE